MKISIGHITLPEDFDEKTDFYIPEDYIEYGIMYPKAEIIKNNKDYMDIVVKMMEIAKEKNKLEFSIEFEHDGHRILFRGHSINTTEGKIYIFRRLPSYIPEIEELGMNKKIVELLLHERLNHGGLVIIAGETGQGKSTTAASAIAYRLKHYGSFCLTIEDPIEMPLQGFYEGENGKKGVCFQTEVIADNIQEAIKGSMRCFPSVSNSILFLGETRDSKMANEVLKCAANGHLVFTTMHGADLTTSLKRFISLATEENVNDSDVKSLFSSVFRLLIHQRIEILPTGSKKLRQMVLFSKDAASQVANRIKTGQAELLSTEIHNQNQMINKGMSIVNINNTIQEKVD